MKRPGRTGFLRAQRNAGFTIIELMAVVSIISILAVIALSAYNDYVIRSKVSEGLAFAAEAKTSVTEYFYSNQRTMPTNNAQAGLPPAASYAQYEYVGRLEIRSTDPRAGTIELTFDIPGMGPDNLLQFIPGTAGVEVTWTCTPPAVNGVPVNLVPPNCRG